MDRVYSGECLHCAITSPLEAEELLEAKSSVSSKLLV